MVAELLKLGVIRASTEITGAQVLLIAKKGSEKLRFCIDYRVVNQATVGREGWPISDIKTMIERLGRKQSKYFGVMDLTSEDEFLHNYRQMHIRCRRANIKLNPRKCRVGLEEIEYLGSLFSSTRGRRVATSSAPN